VLLDNVSRSRVLETYHEVRPYMAEANAIDVIIEKHLASAVSLDDFIIKIQVEHGETENPVLRTDLRIFITRLNKRMKI
jgi:hypothetical protein